MPTCENLPPTSDDLSCIDFDQKLLNRQNGKTNRSIDKHERRCRAEENEQFPINLNRKLSLKYKESPCSYSGVIRGFFSIRSTFANSNCICSNL